MVTWRCTATALAALCSAGLACSPGTERPARITSVSPASAYNDVAFLLTIHGGDFRPAYEFDTMSGTASVKEAFSGVLTPVDAAVGLRPVVIEPVSWDGSLKLRATVPAGVAAGTYDVDITDPRGEVYPFPGGFTSLGVDMRPPGIVIVSPDDDTIVGAGTEVTVSLAADDGEGWLTVLTWSVAWSAGTLEDGTCRVGAAAKYAPCSFHFTAPTPASGPEPLIVTLTAFDNKLNTGIATRPLVLAPRPTLTGISPGVGAADGSTDIVVTGTGFVAPNAASPGSLVLVDGQPIPTEFKSDTRLQAKTAAHDPGSGLVTVSTGGAASGTLSFGFYPRPMVKAIDPERGPDAGGNLVTIVGRYFRPETQIWFTDGASMSAQLLSPSFKSSSRIEGYAPPGMSTVNVVAYDQLGGIGQLMLGYTYESSSP